MDPSARGSSARGANVLGTLQVNALDAARIPGGVGGCGSEEEDGAENRRPPLWSLTPTEWTWGVVGKGERRAALDRARAAGERGGARGVLLAAAEGTSASVTEAVAKGAGAGVSEAVAESLCPSSSYLPQKRRRCCLAGAPSNSTTFAPRLSTVSEDSTWMVNSLPVRPFTKICI